MAHKVLHVTTIDGRHLTIPVRGCEELEELERKLEEANRQISGFIQQLECREDEIRDEAKKSAG